MLECKQINDALTKLINSDPNNKEKCISFFHEVNSLISKSSFKCVDNNKILPNINKCSKIVHNEKY